MGVTPDGTSLQSNAESFRNMIILGQVSLSKAYH